MDKDFDLFEKVLSLINSNGELLKEKLSNKTISFLADYKIPNGITGFLNRFSFERAIRFKHVSFYQVNEMPDENLYEQNQRCIAEKLLIIGWGLNGDFIVLDLENLKVGYVFHDDLWEDESVNPRDIFINLNCSIGEFYYNAITVEDFPVDGYEAEKFIENN
ncbi:hypothetical protein [Paenibacillus sp. V4I5]|uniref:hypothetical protein n=1 Tax=Paenibacillus sp. V4I5 TaxID=3042306 RepID=UPI002791D7BA|nr:hypothetical protein [Paenibacillus sp. V4I5]MDQ0913854.1 hypothetical protein [Paenibacillus sp. V4I5]